MVAIIKTFSFRSSDVVVFDKVRKILEKKHQSTNMSKLVIRLLREYVTKNTPTKNKKFLTQDNFKQKCPPFFASDSVWKEYLGLLEQKEHHDFEIHFDIILNTHHYPVGFQPSSDQESTNTENQCPSVFSPENSWIEYTKHLKEDKFAEFKLRQLEIMELSSKRGSEIWRDLGLKE